VTTDLDKEFDEATSAELTDADIARARLLLGADSANKQHEHITTANYDSIRNFALGCGDDNPLYTDEDYGVSTRWGSQVAPNIMSLIMGAPMLGDPLPADVKKAAKSLFTGIHVFVSGGSTNWLRPIYPGDRLFSYHGEESLDVKESEFAGRSVIQVRRSAKVNQRGELVAEQRVVRVLTERKTARKRGKYAAIEPQQWDDESIARLDDLYAAETRRGAERRYWEDLSVGDALPPMLKGPLTTTDIIAFHAGGYGFAPYGLRSGRLAYQNRKRIPAFYIKNEHGVPDVAQRLHWDSAWAQAIGNPMAYDYGVMRQCWLHHYLTDWAGDDAFIVRQEDSMRKFNYQGDVQYLSGEITDLREDAGMKLVDVSMKMTNQRGQETTFGTATISLPSKSAGAAALPTVAVDAQQKATAMFNRHLELKREKQGTGQTR
jgi:acyl dehydratase